MIVRPEEPSSAPKNELLSFSPKDLLIHTKNKLSPEEKSAVLAIANKCLEQTPDHERNANPIYSGYFVEGWTGVVENPTLLWPLFNFEHGEGDALHGEETAGTLLRAHYASSLPEKRAMIAFKDLFTVDAVRSCGGCRDFMRDNFNPASLIIAANSQQEQIGVWRLEDLLVKIDESHRLKLPELEQPIAEVIQSLSAADFEQQGYWPYHDQSMYPERRYTAMIVIDGKKYKAGGYGPVDFRTIPPVQQLMATLMTELDAGKLPELNHPRKPEELGLYILAQQTNTIPDVVYKDRNQVLELVYRLGQRWHSPDLTLPVLLVARDEDSSKQIYRTDTEQWLPMSFHPKVLAGEG